MHADYLPTTLEGKQHRVTEECAEVIKELAKIGRFGLLSRHPDGGPTNLEALLDEMTDLEHAISEFRNDPSIVLYRKQLTYEADYEID